MANNTMAVQHQWDTMVVQHQSDTMVGWVVPRIRSSDMSEASRPNGAIVPLW